MNLCKVYIYYIFYETYLTNTDNGRNNMLYHYCRCTDKQEDLSFIFCLEMNIMCKNIKIYFIKTTLKVYICGKNLNGVEV